MAEFNSASRRALKQTASRKAKNETVRKGIPGNKLPVLRDSDNYQSAVSKRRAPKKKATAVITLSDEDEEPAFDIDIDCPASRGLIGRVVMKSDASFMDFRDQIAAKMNQHVSRIEIGYRLSTDDAKAGTRQFETLDDFANLIRMLRQRLVRPGSRTRPTTVVIVDLAATSVNTTQVKGKGTKVSFVPLI